MNFDGPVPGIPDASIRVVPELPDHLPGSAPAGMYIEALENQLLIKMPGVARYLVRNGTTIEVAPEQGADAGAVAVYLYGSARGALIHQRGELPLHAATMIPPNGTCAIAICGSSGAGKSTLAAELSRREWILVADDTTRINWDGLRPMVWPSLDTIKLWGDACNRLGVDVATLRRVRANMEKFFLPVPAHAGPAPLGAVVELVPGGRPRLQEDTRVSKLDTFSRHTFRPRQIRPLGRLADHMRIVTQIASAVRVFQLGGTRVLGPGDLADIIIGAQCDGSLTVDGGATGAPPKQTVYVQCADVVREEISSEVVLIHTNNHIRIAIDDIAERIWQLLGTPQTLESLTRDLLEEFDADEAVCAANTDVLLQYLAENEFLRIVRGATDGAP